MIKRVENMYRSGCSMRQIVKETELSMCTVRKILISAGLYATEDSARVSRLLQAGMNQKEIAETLRVSEAWVNSNAPYIREPYLIPSQTENAQEIRKHRANKRKSGV